MCPWARSTAAISGERTETEGQLVTDPGIGIDGQVRQERSDGGVVQAVFGQAQGMFTDPRRLVA